MKIKIRYLLALILASFVFVGCATNRCGKMGELEYKSVRLLTNSSQFDKTLNEAVNGGWRVISVKPESDTGYAYFILERSKH